jgi:hypothetical protein
LYLRVLLQFQFLVLMEQQLRVISSIFWRRKRSETNCKRSQLMREQSVRTQRHITLDEIGRRIALICWT